MRQKSQTTGPRLFAFFAPLALCVLVLLPAVYFASHSPADNQPPPRLTLIKPKALASYSPPAAAPAAPRERLTDADFARHVEELKKRIPGRGFTVVIERPFVVVGDSAPEAVRTQAGTVRWAVEKLKQDFFENDPAEILDVWLFRDAVSYKKHTREIFNDEPTTPYGYYASQHKALIMNIGTGGGTLVHEIVHPFVEANFPECPPWFNEGLGSLYEQSGEEGGHIRGYTNWRLPGLQRAIRDRAVPTFKALTAMDADAFYNEDRGTNYSQARYLLYYLQERGLLVKYYKEFYARRKEDPTGYATLQSVLGLAERDMADFKARWEKFVLGLSEDFRITGRAE